ncbi:hypothetical protein GIB67_002027 [Kingdonia uniflora]|uniref:riboflavin kinase n=1 Tax=Kingdonia uniflora TaxID=39325 RepID=A0A7J7MAE0_9MAGN|nr:hypothetical protein GIB67_002027 [Kingdonia uniflora]
MENIDDGPSSLADQVSGVYFGWAKLNMDEILKVVVGIGWKWDSCTTRRLIQPLQIGKSNKSVFDKHFQVLLVGFIRGLRDKAKKLINIELVEEDKLIACKALDLPIFVQSYQELSVLKIIAPGK